MSYKCILEVKGPEPGISGVPGKQKVQRHVRCQLTTLRWRDGNPPLLSRSRITSDFSELSQQECPMKLERNSNSRCNSIVLH
ncbi:hypothetical protein NPIL_636351 [Nephila pilipes]|uniref:Uncharacterized protein n=1 Tax=Nephila pilipes TaxID=299642 RepID=A0A8X6QBG0_NEPPI|nr:hypothetical protein NPIL_636351 [Nephila pilipes]